MFFKQDDNINSAIQIINTDFLPNIAKELNALLSQINQSESNDVSHLRFFMMVSQFQKEMENLERLLNIVLFPAILSQLHVHKMSRPFNSFNILRAVHNRQKNILKKLREICDEYIMDESWSTDKKQSCYSAFHLEQEFVHYLNYVESTFIPLLLDIREEAKI